MPRTVNNHSFLTAQEWMQRGLPIFVASALEEFNASEADMNQYGCSILTPENVDNWDTQTALDFALEWNGIIGYTSNIIDAVRALDEQNGE